MNASKLRQFRANMLGLGTIKGKRCPAYSVIYIYGARQNPNINVWCHDINDNIKAGYFFKTSVYRHHIHLKHKPRIRS